MRERLFRRVLGAAFDTLPSQVRALHSIDTRATWRGEATITRGKNVLVPVLAAATRLPPSRTRVPTTVEFIATDAGETWQRDFGGARCRSGSRLSPG